MENLNKTWQIAKDLMKRDLNSISYETWIQNLVPLAKIGETVYLQSSNGLELSYIKSRYSTLIRNALHYADSEVNDVVFTDTEEGVPGLQSGLYNDRGENPFNNIENPLNPRYTFDRFVIGENNRFARAACVAVAESPSNIYNPLFIYGGVGLGKTHLMQAVGNFIIDDNQNRRVVYVSCEDFTNEFISSIQNNQSTEFRKKFRSADILLIDDIQFLAGKMETQEAFFHTFNTLYGANKQIVITSDRPPKEIPKLEDRLRSRFEMGLITDISAPSFETRMAIIKKKAEYQDIFIPNEVLEYIAENIHSNIRELEGALTTVTAYANLYHKAITFEDARDALKDLLNTKTRVIDIPYIKKMTAKYFNISTKEMDSKKRTQSIAQPRQVAMYLSRELTENSFPKIGESFGGRDHSTVLHACRKISKDISEQPEFAKLVDTIKTEIVNSTH